jgi:hypothetical protein
MTTPLSYPCQPRFTKPHPYHPRTLSTRQPGSHTSAHVSFRHIYSFDAATGEPTYGGSRVSLHPHAFSVFLLSCPVQCSGGMGARKCSAGSVYNNSKHDGGTLLCIFDFKQNSFLVFHFKKKVWNIGIEVYKDNSKVDKLMIVEEKP